MINNISALILRICLLSYICLVCVQCYILSSNTNRLKCGSYKKSTTYFVKQHRKEISDSKASNMAGSVSSSICDEFSTLPTPSVDFKLCNSEINYQFISDFNTDSHIIQFSTAFHHIMCDSSTIMHTIIKNDDERPFMVIIPIKACADAVSNQPVVSQKTYSTNDISVNLEAWRNWGSDIRWDRVKLSGSPIYEQKQREVACKRFDVFIPKEEDIVTEIKTISLSHKVVEEKAVIQSPLPPISLPSTSLPSTFTAPNDDIQNSHHGTKQGKDVITVATASLPLPSTAATSNEELAKQEQTPSTELSPSNTAITASPKNNNHTASSGTSSTAGAWRNQKIKYDKMSVGNSNSNQRRGGMPVAAADIQWSVLKLSGSPIYEVGTAARFEDILSSPPTEPYHSSSSSAGSYSDGNDRELNSVRSSERQSVLDPSLHLNAAGTTGASVTQRDLSSRYRDSDVIKTVLASSHHSFADTSSPLQEDFSARAATSGRGPVHAGGETEGVVMESLRQKMAKVWVTAAVDRASSYY